jgi:hypothetical protein
MKLPKKCKATQRATFSTPVDPRKPPSTENSTKMVMAKAKSTTRAAGLQKVSMRPSMLAACLHQVLSASAAAAGLQPEPVRRALHPSQIRSSRRIPGRQSRLSRRIPGRKSRSSRRIPGRKSRSSRRIPGRKSRCKGHLCRGEMVGRHPRNWGRSIACPTHRREHGPSLTGRKHLRLASAHGHDEPP